ncbi:unnamed protein product [Caenorhabditis sp. 36 PRJEB53466]|nr:unnamed protein product [Caenorhabditis sp. 36 PRJEB53466]
MDSMEVDNEENVCRSAHRLSKALDRRDIGDVCVALEDLLEGTNADHFEDIFSAALNEIITWEISKAPETSELVLRRLMDPLKNGVKMRQICEKILRMQTVVATRIAVEVMKRENWKLSMEAVQEALKKIVGTMREAGSIDPTEFERHIAANADILKASGAPPHVLTKLIADSIVSLQRPDRHIAPDFVQQLVLNCPFHPLLVLHDLRNTFEVFCIQRVVSPFHRFHLEVDQFNEFVNSKNGYRSSLATSMLFVFENICNRLIHLEGQFETEEIERIADFWLAAFRIFDGDSIGLQETSRAIKLLEATTEKFDVARRPLFLKRLLHKMSLKKEVELGLEAQIVAAIITVFKQQMYDCNYFYEELGSFWPLCARMKYDDVHYAIVYFSAVFVLAKAMAAFRVKKELCRVVYETVMKPMNEQIADYLRVEEIGRKKQASGELNFQQQFIQDQKEAQAGQFTIIECTYKDAEQSILDFIN